MKLEQQVVSLELAKKLKELGVKQEGLFAWVGDDDIPHAVRLNRESLRWPDAVVYVAFTVAELGEMLKEHGLPDYDPLQKHWYRNFSKPRYSLVASGTEADARAKMLIYLIENGLIKI